jgi:signal transduction histidine kinase
MSGELRIPDELDMAAFISKEAHDLKSPFNRALGFLKLVLKGMDGPISDQAKEDLNIAYQNTLYTLAMMSNLVDMARLGRGERNPTLALRPLTAIIQQAVFEWKRQYPKDNLIDVTFTAPEATILADETMLRQGLGKWLSYVAEFVQESVVVDIQVEELEADCQFTIRSKGKKTLPPPECDLTMHGFIAHHILALHHGKLEALEEDDEGAWVRFNLPKGS